MPSLKASAQRSLRRATRGGSFQRSRMVRQPAVNRSFLRFDSFRWSPCPCRPTVRMLDFQSGDDGFDSRPSPRLVDATHGRNAS